MFVDRQEKPAFLNGLLTRTHPGLAVTLRTATSPSGRVRIISASRAVSPRSARLSGISAGARRRPSAPRTPRSASCCWTGR